MRRHACAKAWQERQDVLITRMGALRAGRNAAIGSGGENRLRYFYQGANHGGVGTFSYSIAIAS
ncbi:hypothetical protein LMG33810_001869 [Carnimonas sp. LMG 33810]